MKRVVFLLCLCTIVMCGHIGLFASTGAYSHDKLMRTLADRLTLTGGHRVTIIQVRVFDFNLSLPSPRAKWNYIGLNSTDEESISVQRHSQRMMWLTTMPFDGTSLDLRGMRILAKIYSLHLRACFKALRDPSFMNRIKNLDLDLIVIDHVLNDCAVFIAHALQPNVKIVLMSNYPIVSCYVDNTGVPSNPSYVPSLFSMQKLPMNLPRRIRNTLLYAVIVATRIIYYYNTQRTFKLALDLDIPTFTKLDRKTLMAATPFEMMLDVPRPMRTGLRYFGCDHCWNDINERGNISQVLSLPISESGVVLVSFGTVTKGDLIPLEQLQRLIRVFAKFPQYTIIWQLDASKERYERAVINSLNSTSFASHIHIYSWLPLTTLLTDPRVVLLVSHGGVTTCMEAVNSAVPVLGIAIQGDQLYNLQRFVEKGVGEFIQVARLSESVLHQKLKKMTQEHKKYKKAASKLQSMLNDYKSLERLPSAFWLSWAVRHFGQAKWNHTRRVDKFIYSRHSSNWIVYLCLDCLFAACVSLTLTAYMLSIF